MWQRCCQLSSPTSESLLPPGPANPAPYIHPWPPYIIEAMFALDSDAAWLLDARRYLEEASVTAAYAELASGRHALLQALTDAAGDPAKLAELGEELAAWRRDYAVQYTKTHTTNVAVQRDILGLIEEARTDSVTLEVLNAVSDLGPPAAEGALRRLRELGRARSCGLPPSMVNQAVKSAPVCACGFSLGDRPSRLQAARAAREIERAVVERVATYLELRRDPAVRRAESDEAVDSWLDAMSKVGPSGAAG